MISCDLQGTQELAPPNQLIHASRDGGLYT